MNLFIAFFILLPSSIYLFVRAMRSDLSRLTPEEKAEAEAARLARIRYLKATGQWEPEPQIYTSITWDQGRRVVTHFYPGMRQ
jgi:hypothetical protein